MYKLMIVDDEQIEREALKYIFNQADLQISEIREAANGQEAIKLAADFEPDIVTIDIRMPGLNGIEASYVLKKMRPSMKIVLVTAYDNFEYAHEAIKLGVEEFIVKPASDEATIEIVRKCIEKLDADKNLRVQREKLESKIGQISRYLENEFVSSVVNGEIDEQQADDYLMFMLNEFTEGFGVVIEMNFSEEEGLKHLNRNIMIKRFAEQLSELLDGKMQFMMNQMKNQIQILVFGYRKEQRTLYVRTIEDEIQMLRDEIDEQSDTRIFYGFGEGYNQISLLWKSFAQAKAGLRNSRLDEEDSNENNDDEAYSEIIDENTLCTELLKGNRDRAIPMADYILDTIVFATSDINETRLKLFEFFTLLDRFLTRDSQVKNAMPDYLYDDLKSIDSRGEAKNYIHRYLLEILDAIEAQHTNKTPVHLDKAITYIEEHFDEGITIEEVAGVVGFSAYYFGKIFKKTFNKSFTEYLTEFRIDKAKKYLMDPNETVKDVTYKVGYMDPNYFARVFKKHEGVTPTEFRNKL